MNRPSAALLVLALLTASAALAGEDPAKPEKRFGTKPKRGLTGKASPGKVYQGLQSGNRAGGTQGARTQPTSAAAPGAVGATGAGPVSGAENTQVYIGPSGGSEASVTATGTSTVVSSSGGGAPKTASTAVSGGPVRSASPAACGQPAPRFTVVDIDKAPPGPGPQGGHITLTFPNDGRPHGWALRFKTPTPAAASTANYPFTTETLPGAELPSTFRAAVSKCAAALDEGAEPACGIPAGSANGYGMIEVFLPFGRSSGAARDGRHCVLDVGTEYFFNVEGTCSGAAPCKLMTSVANMGLSVLGPGGLAQVCATRGMTATPNGCR